MSARPARRPAAALAALLLLLLGLAQAQTDIIQDATYGFTMGYPSSWQRSEEPNNEGGLLYGFIDPDESGLMLLITQPMAATEVAEYRQRSRESIDTEVWDAFSAEVPGSQMIGSREVLVSGLPASAIDFDGPGMRGAIVYLLTDTTLYTFAFVGMEGRFAEAQAAFDGMLSSFTLTSAGGSTPSQPPSINLPPSLGTPPANPQTPPAGQNPLAPPAGQNPLAPASDPFVGTFANEQLSLTLRGGGGQYEGEILFGGQTYPVMAQANGQVLSGVFLSGGNQFPFNATLDGSMLDFETAGTRYLLSK